MYYSQILLFILLFLSEFVVLCHFTQYVCIWIFNELNFITLTVKLEVCRVCGSTKETNVLGSDITE